MFLDIRGTHFNTVSFGSGATTLVAHGGWTGSWELWQQPFELLSPTWRCVSYDHRGSGQTVVTPDSITADTLVDDLFDVLDALGVGRCVLAGESMGGVVAMAAAVRAPERFEGLVLVSTPVPGDVRPGALIAGSRHDYPATVAGFARACLPEPDSAVFLRWGSDILLRSDGELAAKLLEVTAEMVVDPGAIRLATLVIHGSADVIVAASAARHLAATIPGAELLMLDGAGHVPTFTRPYQVADAIQRMFGIRSV